MKNAKGQAYFLPNYEDGKFGVDVIVTINEKEEPFLDYKMLLKPCMSNEFIKEMTEHEKALAKFLSAYYDTSFTKRYTNVGKVCTIKELDLIREETTCSSPS